MPRSYKMPTIAVSLYAAAFLSLNHFLFFKEALPLSNNNEFKSIVVVRIKTPAPLPPTIPAPSPPSLPTYASPPDVINSPLPVAVHFSTSMAHITLPQMSPLSAPQLPAPNGTMRVSGQGNAGGAGSGSAGGQSVNIFGMDVASDGPIVAYLDTSESLKAQHDLVEQEIKKLLPSAIIVEINGVVFSTRVSIERLKQNDSYASYLANYYLSLVDGSIIPQITTQIQNNQLTTPMTIYYFSDFQDYVDRKDVDAFSQLLQDNHIRFYAYSVEKEPNDAIKRMCTDTGGEWKVKSPESP